MNIRINKPEPVVTPPPTFDLIGLSQEEVDMLRYFATLAPAHARDQIRAANRFLVSTMSISSTTFSPDKCFK